MVGKVELVRAALVDGMQLLLSTGRQRHCSSRRWTRLRVSGASGTHSASVYGVRVYRKFPEHPPRLLPRKTSDDI